MGNLVRHILTIKDLECPKAQNLAERLNLVSPHVEVEAVSESLENCLSHRLDQLQQYELMIDCTGSDSVLHRLESLQWDGLHYIVSFAVGLGAKRLYCMTSFCNHFPLQPYQQALSPWLEKDINEWGDQELPREGVGCWHPVFPARADDIWLMAANAVKEMEGYLKYETKTSILTVYEQTYKDGIYIGTLRVHVEEVDA
jgi:hypothetical protein